MAELDLTNLPTTLDNLTEDDFSELIGMLMGADEDVFQIVAPQIREQFTRMLNNAADRLVLVQAINSLGGKAEDVREVIDVLNKEIDDSVNLSVQKRDFFKTILNDVLNSIAETEGIAKRFIKIPIEKCHPDAVLPAYAHVSDSGMDVYAIEDITIAPGETKLIPTGIKVALPPGYELQVRPKSGLSARTKLRVSNTPGTIDQDYRDEIKIIIENVDPPIRAINTSRQGDLTVQVDDPLIHLSDITFGQSYTISKGMKFCQLVLMEVPKAVWNEVDSVATIGENRGGGFGSTDNK